MRKRWTLERHVKDALRIAVYGFNMKALYRPIEDSSGNLGTFDTFIGVPGVPATDDAPPIRAMCGWIEVKFCGPNAAPVMRPGQPSFGQICKDAGVSARVLVGHPDGSCRVLEGTTTGRDWRDRLVLRHSTIDRGLVYILLG